MGGDCPAMLVPTVEALLPPSPPSALIYLGFYCIYGTPDGAPGTGGCARRGGGMRRSRKGGVSGVGLISPFSFSPSPPAWDEPVSGESPQPRSPSEATSLSSSAARPGMLVVLYGFWDHLRPHKNPVSFLPGGESPSPAALLGETAEVGEKPDGRRGGARPGPGCAGGTLEPDLHFLPCQVATSGFFPLWTRLQGRDIPWVRSCSPL